MESNFLSSNMEIVMMQAAISVAEQYSDELLLYRDIDCPLLVCRLGFVGADALTCSARNTELYCRIG